MTTQDGNESNGLVIPWADRDRNLERKLRQLYEEHLESWIAMQGDRRFEQKWHVGRVMLDWFYSQLWVRRSPRS